MAHIIAVANQKGGVGKTTTAVNLAACLADRGYETLLIDLDPQGNASDSLIEKTDQIGYINEVLIDSYDGKSQPTYVPLEDVLYETTIPNLDLAPADIRLARFDLESEFNMHRLKAEMQKLKSYTFVIIDCPPQLGKLLATALIASQKIIIPIPADYLSLAGISDLLYTINKAKTANSDLDILGVLINRFDIRKRLSTEAFDALHRRFGKHLFDTLIHEYTKIAEAPAHRLPVHRYAPDHRSATLYQAFTEEVLGRLNFHRQNIRVFEGGQE